MIDRSVVKLFGVSMHAWTIADTVECIRKRLEEGVFTQHVVVNVAKLVHMQSDPVLAESVTSCDIINIDGAGVVAGGRMLGLDIPERVAGVDLFHMLLTMAEKNKRSVYMLGAKEPIIEEAVRRVKEAYPELKVAGYHHGYFWEDEAEVVRDIALSGAEMLFVAITSPKKENFINKWKKELGVNFVMGVGGTFDVVAGYVKRAPLWMQKWGMEWIYRVIQEPDRMWKRYLVTNSQFLWMLIKGLINSNS